MTDKKTEALKLALEYLRDNQHYIADNERHAYVMEYNAFVERLEALAEQPAQQEPYIAFNADIVGYVAPQRTWVGLTDEERAVIVEANTTDDHGYDIWCDGDGVARVVEAKLKEKNT